MFAPLFNVYHFYGQVNLQMYVCYAQVNFFTRYKFKVCWLTLFDRSLNFINFMSAWLSRNVLGQLTLLRYGAT